MGDLDKFIGDWNESRDARLTLLKVELIGLREVNARLQAENERLRKEVEVWKFLSTQDGIACNERAKENQELENQIYNLRRSTELSCWDGTKWQTRYQIGSQVL